MSAKFTCDVSGASSHLKHAREHQDMGEPKYLSSLQVDRLEAASHLVREPLCRERRDGTVRLDIDLPPHAAALVTLEFPSAWREGSGRA